MDYINVLQFLYVPCIAAVVYGFMEIINKAVNGNEKFKRVIPLLSLIVGAVFGIVFFYALPDVINSASIWEAIIKGAASGGLAVCGDQVIKQLTKNSSDDTDKTDTDSTEDTDGGNGDKNE